MHKSSKSFKGLWTVVQ